VLGQLGNQVINDNQELLYDNMVPVMENDLGEAWQKSANQIFGSAPLDEILPET
jgi:hypothetical protein